MEKINLKNTTTLAQTEVKPEAKQRFAYELHKQEIHLCAYFLVILGCNYRESSKPEVCRRII